MRWATWLIGLCAGVATATLALPGVLVEIGRRQARACFERVEAPRGAELPRCDALGAWFQLGTRAPWTRREANILLEELEARMAVARYVDAAVGTPSTVELDRRRERVLAAAKAVRAGTGLLRMSELGPAMPAPDLGELAFSVGDADALDHYAFDWTQWFTSTHAIEAALLRVDLPRAVRLAQHYGGRPDPDQRLRVGALLCLSGETQRGFDEVESVAEGRAEKRSANFARNFGSARVIAEACATLGGLPQPAVPSYGSAGEWDHRERLAAMRLRLARQDPGCDSPPRYEGCTHLEHVGELTNELIDLLSSGTTLSYRPELFAMVAPEVSDGAVATVMAQSHNEEPKARERAPLTVLRLVERGAGPQPFVPAAQLERAAGHALRLARDSSELRTMAGVLLVHAAAAYAGQGDRERALETARRAAPLVVDGEIAAALFRSSVAYVAGDDELAVSTLEGVLGPKREPTAALAAAWLQLGEIRAALGRSALALEAARQGLTLARMVSHDPLVERGEWLVLALEGCALAASRGGSGARPGPAFVPPVGPPDSDVPVAVRELDRQAAQAVWRAWVQDSAAERRAHRYAAFRRGRGDAPDACVPHLVLGGLLVDSPDQVETWLDAFYAIDAGRMSLRAYSWARAQAARWRADDPAYRLWLERYRALERLANDPVNAELYQELGL